MTDVPQPPLQAEWQVILNDGSNAVKIVPVPHSGLLIGRAPTADLHLDDPRVSRHHARLTWQGDQLFIEDLQTVNGTLLNGQPLNQPAAVRPNDLIGLGPFILRVEQSFVPVTPPPQVTPPLQEIQAYSQPEPSFVPVTPPPQEIRVYPQPEPSLAPVTPPTQETRAHPQSKPPIWGLLLAAGLAGFMLVGLLCGGVYWYWFSGQDTPAAALTGPTLTISQAPASNSAVSLHQPITVQALASDATGVTRLELWANGRKVDEVDTQLVEVAPTLNAALQWRTSQPGPLTLEVRAYNSAGQVSTQTISNLRVADQTNTPAVSEPTAPPNPTVAPLLPTATLTPAPAATFTPSPTPSPGLTSAPVTSTSLGALLTLNVPALNVRSGPGTQYSLIGQLTQSAPAEIVGQASAEQGQWWQIRFANGPGGVGWVTADPAFVTTSNTTAVPVVNAPTLQLPEVTAQPTDTPSPAPTATATAPREQVIRAPAGKTLLIASNRTMANYPALLTLSEGESVGGGDRVEVPADGEVQLVLEPDFYRATWTSPGPRGGFASGADFTAVEDKIMVMWIVPEEGRSAIETYDELTVAVPTPTPTPTPIGTATPGPIRGSYPGAPAGKALFVAANGTLENNFAVVTLSGGGLSGGQEIKLDAGAEIPVELLPGSYRAVWTSPARQRAFSTGREFQVSEGEVILSWIVPEQGQVFMQFPGQDPQQINK